MYIAWRNPNSPQTSKPVISAVQTIPESAGRYYRAVSPSMDNYLYVLDGGKPRFDIARFLGGAA